MTDTKKLELIRQILTPEKLNSELEYFYGEYKADEDEEQYKFILDDLNRLFDLLYPEEEETEGLR